MGMAGGAGNAQSLGANSLNQAFSAATTQQLQQLTHMLKDFSSAEILIALMLMRGDDDSKNKVHGGGGGGGGGGAGALIGLLAGLALAGQVGQMTSDLTLTVQSAGGGAAAGGGGVGGQINMQI